MNLETKAFLDGVRHAEDPTVNDERRVLAAVRAALAASVVTTVGVGAFEGAKGFVPTGATVLKLGLGVVGLSAIVWVVGASPPLDVTDRPAPSRPASSVERQTRAPLPSAFGTHAEPPPTEPSARLAIPRRARSETEAPSLPPSLRDEIALLADVKAALERSDGAAALRKLDAHATTDRQLLAERSAARILALCLLGRADEARARAAEFSKRHPTSVQRTAIERSCAGSKSTGER